MEVEVRSPAEIHRLAKKLKELGEKDLRRDLTRAIREATAPTKNLIRQSELAKLPKRGGLAAATARNKISNRVRMSQRDPGVTINITADYDLKSMDRGRLRHPVFHKKGGKKVWVNQKIQPGVVTGPIELTRPRVQESIMEALRDIARQLDN